MVLADVCERLWLLDPLAIAHESDQEALIRGSFFMRTSKVAVHAIRSIERAVYLFAAWPGGFSFRVFAAWPSGIFLQLVGAVQVRRV